MEVDGYGNKQHHKPQYVIRKDRMYETDAYGRVKQRTFSIKKAK